MSEYFNVHDLRTENEKMLFRAIAKESQVLNFWEKCVSPNVVIEKDEDGYLVASVSSLKGCHTQAKTMDELLESGLQACEHAVPGFA